MTDNLLKVLILEDLKTDQELVKRQVTKYNPNCTFIIAHNRKSFFEKMEWLKPDLILADYELPDFNGLEALFFIKEKMPNIPFVFISATLNDEEKVAATVLNGASGYLLKENLHALPGKLEKIMSTSAKRIAEANKKAEAQRMRKMLLNKLEAKISQIKDDSSKTELLAILQEMHSLKC